MQIEKCVWTEKSGWSPTVPGRFNGHAQLVFIFGSHATFQKNALIEQIKAAYPEAILFGCTTAGEISDTQVLDDSITSTAVRFEHTKLKYIHRPIEQPEDSLKVGLELGEALVADQLKHVLVLTEGVHINGSEFVKGLVSKLPQCVTATGGLSGDGERMEETYVLADGQPRQKTISAVGFYSNQRLKIGYGSLGGWDPFGPDRLITRSEGNVLFEMDGKSALELYKTYLGEHAKGLPATGLLFPLSLRMPGSETGVVRTVLAVNEKEQSMTFAGDVPEGAYARLMKANFDRLIDGASGAAETCYQAIKETPPDLGLLISCVGRKMVLKQRVEEEVESVREMFGNNTVLTGFYSYGEISPFTPHASCELHNQTMSITTISEH